ncbi:hypothetical protein [Sphingomonas sp. Leaf16]|uniref:hypothetical protein n=2 Tax=Sphingomonas TaxID=13687 RepID=UPI0012E1147C|nr:hypothetical protein [Sphingomonas sp. Leaf16]
MVPTIVLAAMVPAPASYTVQATVSRDGKVIATPRMSVTPGTPAMIATDSYQLMVRVDPVLADKVRVESSFVPSGDAGVEPVARVSLLTTTGMAHYSFDGPSEKFAVSLVVRAN